jgi:hypothetical protein
VSAIAFIFGFRFFGFGVLGFGAPTASVDAFFFFSLTEKEEVNYCSDVNYLASWRLKTLRT